MWKSRHWLRVISGFGLFWSNFDFPSNERTLFMNSSAKKNLSTNKVAQSSCCKLFQGYQFGTEYCWAFCKAFFFPIKFRDTIFSQFSYFRISREAQLSSIDSKLSVFSPDPKCYTPSWRVFTLLFPCNAKVSRGRVHSLPSVYKDSAVMLACFPWLHRPATKSNLFWERKIGSTSC